MDAHNVTKLGEALEVLCLDCTRYDASDELAKGLAIISLIPYLAVFHIASVSSAATLLLQLCLRPRDRCKDAVPHGCTAESLHAAAQVIYSRRQLHDVTILMGMVICAAAAKALKAFLKHTRYTVSSCKPRRLTHFLVQFSVSPCPGGDSFMQNRTEVQCMWRKTVQQALKERQAYLARLG